MLPYSEIAAAPDPLNVVASVALNPIAGVIMSFIALFATANTVLIMLIVTTRMVYGMSRDDSLPKSLSKISEKHKTPTKSVFLSMIITIVMLFFGDLSFVANATVFGVLIGFFLVNLSVIVLRKNNPNVERPFRLKPNIIKWIPVISLLGCIVCARFLFIFDWIIIVIQGIIILICLLVYYSKKMKA